MSQSFTSILFRNGFVRSATTQLGINSTPSSLSLSVVVEEGEELNISLREFVTVTIGSLIFRGIIQGFEKTIEDISGKNIYSVKITDTRPILNAVQVILNSPFSDTGDTTQPKNFGTNVISIEPDNALEIEQGLPFAKIKNAINALSIVYFDNTFNVNLNFNAPPRGLNGYSIRGSVLSLSDLLSQIANDHGLDWFAETTENKTINITMFNRKNAGMSRAQFLGIHEDLIIRHKEGLENRDPVLKTVLLGGYRQVLVNFDGGSFDQYWGLDDDNNIRTSPVFDRATMENVINGDFDTDDFTQESLQKILDFANEFWGRRFIGTLASTELDEDGNSWHQISSAAWWESDSIPGQLNNDGVEKFQTEDGRWVCFVEIPLAGIRFVESADAVLDYTYSEKLFSSPNIHAQNDNRKVFIKATAEIFGDKVIITLANPIRVKKVTRSLEDGTTIDDTKESRGELLERAFVPILDQRNSYGPYYNNNIANTLFNNNSPSTNGRAEVIIDTQLVPWSFGFRGITNQEGIDQLKSVAAAKIKTIVDNTTDSDIFELEVAGLPLINIAQQVVRGLINFVSVNFSTGGVSTIYRTREYTDEFSRFRREQQDLMDRLKREAGLRNTANPPKDDFSLEKAQRSARKDVFDPSDYDTLQERDFDKVILGKIDERVPRNIGATTDEPKYHVIPHIWQSDVFGSLSFVRDPNRPGRLLNVINMSENPDVLGRLPIGKKVEVKVFSINEAGVVAYYMNEGIEKPSQSTGTIVALKSTTDPIYEVSLNDDVRNDLLLDSEILLLQNITNIGEPIPEPNVLGLAGLLQVGQQVTVNWIEKTDGTFQPVLEQQVNFFRPSVES